MGRKECADGGRRTGERPYASTNALRETECDRVRVEDGISSWGRVRLEDRRVRGLALLRRCATVLRRLRSSSLTSYEMSMGNLQLSSIEDNVFFHFVSKFLRLFYFVEES